MRPKIYPVIHFDDHSSAMEQVDIANDAGCPGVFLINHYAEPVEETSVMADTLAAIKNSTDMEVGANFLHLLPLDALALAYDFKLDMLWLDNLGITGAGWNQTAEDFAELWGQRTLEDAHLLKVFPGVAFKYQRAEGDPKGAAEHARRYGAMVPTTSGPATGQAPDLEKIKLMSNNGISRLAVASGMTPDNIKEFGPYLSHVLVATGVSVDGVLDFQLLRRMVLQSESADLFFR